MVRFLLTRASWSSRRSSGSFSWPSFCIRLVPGDPVEVRVGERGISPERHAQLMHDMGLDRPLYVQFFDYVGGVLQGDLGTSVVTHRPVLDEFFTLFPATLELSFCALLLAPSCVGLPAGVVRRGEARLDLRSPDHGRRAHRLFHADLLVGPAAHPHLLACGFGWTPVSGRIDNDYYFEGTSGFMIYDAIMSDEDGAFISAVSHLILPTIVLGTIPLAVIARMTRSAMLEVLGEDYIRTARAKGLSTCRVVGIHALRNALIPVVTVIGLQVGTLMAGAILTETTFSWPGIGTWLVESDQPPRLSGAAGRRAADRRPGHG